MLPVVWDSEKVMEYHGTVHGVTRVNVHLLFQSSHACKQAHPWVPKIASYLQYFPCFSMSWSAYRLLLKPGTSPPRNSLRHNSGLKRVLHLNKIFSEHKILFWQSSMLWSKIICPVFRISVCCQIAWIYFYNPIFIFVAG